MGGLRAEPTSATTPAGFTLIRLTPTGWQTVINGELIPYATGVLGDQLAAQTILSNTDTTRIPPSPDTWRSLSRVGAADSGVTTAKPDRNPPNTASSRLTSHSITQIVMAKGSQTNRPVSRYFLMGTRNSATSQS